LGVPLTGILEFFVPYLNFNRTTPLNLTGYQFAHLGSSYIGIYSYALTRTNDSKQHREYIQNEVSETLA
jgi:cbb3-type cytochrome oxidase subunit 1